MPELPEVETMRRGVLAIEGATIEVAQRTPCSKRPISIKPRIDHLNRRVAGTKIVSVDRLGKRVVLRLETGDRLIFEPRMTGLVLIGNPPGREHLRFSLALSDGPVQQLLFWDRRGLGRITLLTARQYQEKREDGSLGPDALEITLPQMVQRFQNSTTPVKVALLDQSRVAGVGNLYASEILHLAKVHPGKACNQVRKNQWQRIHQQMGEVLQLAIEHEGSTLSDGTYRNALNDPGSYQNQHCVYDREGQLCPTCLAAKIQRIVQAQRSTFYCKQCQKR
jgi:formamidopyrimidine-DNA glycosylase